MLDETITDEALALKDALKAKRDTCNISNQEIADRAGLSIHTVTNYFSSRSKASSAYTVGKICMALNMSFDRAFGIVPEDSPAELNENLAKIAELERSAAEGQRKSAADESVIAQLTAQLKSQKLHFKVVLTALIVVLALFAAYIVCFDLPNPNYGIIRSEAFSCAEQMFYSAV